MVSYQNNRANMEDADNMDTTADAVQKAVQTVKLNFFKGQYLYRNIQKSQNHS